MIHVAEAGEAKGRVVVHLSSSRAHPIALDAAIWLARAFQSEIEGLYVENQQLIELASFPFACEISLSGRARRSIGCEDIEQEFRHASAAFHAEVEARARAAEVPVRPRIVRDEPVSALHAVCSDCGPWNAVALTEPFTSPSCPSLKDLLDTVRDATGLLVVGPRSQRMTGPIVIALEHVDMLAVMLSAADRLASVRAGEIAVCLIAADEDGLAELDAAARLVLAERQPEGEGTSPPRSRPQSSHRSAHRPAADNSGQPDRPFVRLAATTVTFGAEAAAAESMRRLDPGIIIGRFGGILVPEHGDLRALATSLECPLLLLR